MPNTPTSYEFYEYTHCHFRITVLANGFDEPSVFYPMVRWSNGPDARSGAAALREPASAC